MSTGLVHPKKTDEDVYAWVVGIIVYTCKPTTFSNATLQIRIYYDTLNCGMFYLCKHSS